jgi:predicted ATP-grasp superfamily ATP-dependent carboligase
VSEPGAVVIGGYVNGLGVVRALAARGVRVAVVTTQPFDVAQLSRHCAAHHPAPGAEQGALMELLERRVRDWRGWALIPTNDEAVEALAPNHERLASAGYRVLSPPPEVARAFLDKGVMQDAARAVGAELPRVGEGVGFPVLVKPVTGHRFAARFGTKLLVARDGEELEAHLARVGGEDVQLAELIPGEDSRIYAHCTYLDAHGDPLGAITIRKLRQSPPFFGVARVAEVAADPPPELPELTVELLRRVGHRGPAIAEFKLDPRDGRPKFIEANGRSVLYNALLRRAGLDQAGLAWAEHVEGRRERARPNGWPGAWVNLHADLLYTLLRRRDQRLGPREFARPYARPLIEAVWSPTDPRPFLAQWGRTARTAMRRP